MNKIGNVVLNNRIHTLKIVNNSQKQNENITKAFPQNILMIL